jgi:hydrogenase maturation protein HypF
MAIQHHHAHIVSCLAENGVVDPVIGIALDGTGLGSDGQVWGGEILLADPVSFQRAAHLEYVVLPGGDAAARFPWRMALSFLHKAYGEKVPDLPIGFMERLDPQEAGIVMQIIRKTIGSRLTSSCGRLFDAVAALIGLRSKISYDGQAAIELEMCQNLREKGRYPWDIHREKGQWILSTSPMIRAVVEDILKGVSPRVISRRFHLGMIDLITEACLQVGGESGIGKVALSGGAFQNATILAGLIRSLASKGFEVYSHRLVPANDGGLSLGQAVIAGMRHGGVAGSFGKNEIHG